MTGYFSLFTGSDLDFINVIGLVEIDMERGGHMRPSIYRVIKGYSKGLLDNNKKNKSSGLD